MEEQHCGNCDREGEVRCMSLIADYYAKSNKVSALCKYWMPKQSKLLKSNEYVTRDEPNRNQVKNRNDYHQAASSNKPKEVNDLYIMGNVNKNELKDLYPLLGHMKKAPLLKYTVTRHLTSGKCVVCETTTDFFDMDLNVHICSIECLRHKWKKRG